AATGSEERAVLHQDLEPLIANTFPAFERNDLQAACCCRQAHPIRVLTGAQKPGRVWQVMSKLLCERKRQICTGWKMAITQTEDRSSFFGFFPDPDHSLVEASKAGDVKSFQRLTEGYGPRLSRLAERITKNREDAEDAVQDALLLA